MHTTALVWLRAQGFYALFMLPTILFPPMFFLAEFYAWIWGIAALPLFYLLLLWLRRKQWYPLSLIIMAGLVIAFACTYGAAWHFASFQNPWKAFIEWIWFPAAGWGAALLSIIASRKSIRRYILNEDEIVLADLEEALIKQTT